LIQICRWLHKQTVAQGLVQSSLWTDQECFTCDGVFHFERVTFGCGVILVLIAKHWFQIRFSVIFELIWLGTSCNFHLLNDITIFGNMFYRDCLKICLLLCDSECNYITTEIQHAMDKASGNVSKRHTQEGGLHIDDRLH